MIKLEKITKTFSIALIVCFITLLSVSKTSAFSINEVSDNKIENDTIVFRILATPSEKNQNAVSLRLEARDLEIVSFTPSSDENWLNVIGECGEGKTFTPERICASMAKTSGIINDEVLADVVVRFKDSEKSEGMLLTTEGGGYATTKDFFAIDAGKEFPVKLLERRVDQADNSTDLTANILLVLLAFALVIMLILAFFSSFRSRVF